MTKGAQARADHDTAELSTPKPTLSVLRSASKKLLTPESDLYATCVPNENMEESASTIA